MTCKKCGKPIPEFAKIIGKEFCSKKCEDRSPTSNPVEDLFSSFKQ